METRSWDAQTRKKKTENLVRKGAVFAPSALNLFDAFTAPETRNYSCEKMGTNCRRSVKRLSARWKLHSTETQVKRAKSGMVVAASAVVVTIIITSGSGDGGGSDGGWMCAYGDLGGGKWSGGGGGGGVSGAKWWLVVVEGVWFLVVVLLLRWWTLSVCCRFGE
jgi:hypothetical protein